MDRASDAKLFLVLSSRRSFEALTGPVPESLRSRFHFEKPHHELRIQRTLPECRLVISKNYRRPTSNRWIFEARRLGVPTLLLVDGPLEWSNLYSETKRAKRQRKKPMPLFEPVVHDAVACIGPAQQEWIAHKNDGRGITLMNYSNRRMSTPTDSSETRAATNTEFDFLLTTAKTAYFGDRERSALFRVIESCASALDRAGHRVLVRVSDPTLLELIKTRLPGCQADTDGPFGDALARTRCVIGTPSSVLLEAMQNNKPTGQLMFRDSPLFYQSGWLLGCNDDWSLSFESMLAANPKRMDLQRRTLRENLGDEDFFSICRDIEGGGRLQSPRATDLADIEFERDGLRALLGWRARVLSPALQLFRARFR